MNLAKISIKRPTFISAIIIIMLIVGFIFMKKMSVDMFPDVNFPFVTVTTIYPGAGPKELETLVSKKLEEQISSIAGVKNVSSINQDGISTVIAEFTLETDSKYAEQQVKDKVAYLKNDLPDDAKEPIIKRMDPADQPVVILSLTADLPETELFDLADTKIKNAFEQIKNVGNVEIIGGTKREIHVDLDYNKIKEYEVSVSQVAGHIGANSQNIPIGKVNKGIIDLSFRSLGEFKTIQQIKDVIVSFFGSDVPITVEKIGKVIDTKEEIKTKSYLNGKQSLVLQVYKQSGANSVAIADEIKKRADKLNGYILKSDINNKDVWNKLIIQKYINSDGVIQAKYKGFTDEFKALNNIFESALSKSIRHFKGSPEVKIVRDTSDPVRQNILDVKITIFEGIILAIIVVYLFLGNWRSTFITVVALPNSLIGAFIFMGMANFSINVLTLMSLSLAVGLLIDDAIVVRENIYRHIEEGMPPKEAAQKGTDEVTLAVIATTLTVIAVFLPVGFLQGIVGQFFKQFGLTVVFAMSISLFDALTTAPMLSAYLMSNKKPNKYLNVLINFPAIIFGKIQDLMDYVYEKIIRITLKLKIIVIILAICSFYFSLKLTPFIPKTFMPQNEFGEFAIKLETDPGTSIDEMDKWSKTVEKILNKEKDIDLLLTTIGNANGESNVANIYVKMIPSDKRTRSTTDMKDYCRKILEPYKEQINPVVADIQMVGDDAPFMLIITGEDLDELSNFSNLLIDKFKNIPGLVDLSVNYKPGKPEFQIIMDPIKMEKLGVQSTTAGLELRGMVEGIIPAKFREAGFEYDIRVRLQEDQRDLSKEFNNIYVPNVNKQLVKLKNISDPINTSGPAKIFRRNRARYVMITGYLGKNGAVGNVVEEAKNMLAREKFPKGVEYQFIGESEDMEDLFKNMVIAAILSIIFIYLVLASLYESIIIPFTIMIALPLAIVGGLIALYVTHESLNIFSMIGFIMLLGLVTKNSILLVDYAQKLTRKGLAHREAIIKAGLIRLRPILMTTFALIAGMIPLALGLSEVGRFRKSMGIVIIGGLISSTILTLIVIPAIFEFMDKLRLFLRKLIGRPKLREIDMDEIN